MTLSRPRFATVLVENVVGTDARTCDPGTTPEMVLAVPAAVVLGPWRAIVLSSPHGPSAAARDDEPAVRVVDELAAEGGKPAVTWIDVGVVDEAEPSA